MGRRCSRAERRVYVEEHELPDPASRPAWRHWPLVRGCVSFVESMALSFKAMNLAADHAYDAEGETFASLLAAGRVPDAADPAAASGAADGEPIPDSASAAGSESADPRRWPPTPPPLSPPPPSPTPYHLS